MYRRYAGLFSFKSDNARNKKAQNAPSDQPAGQFAEPLRQGAYFQQGVVTGEIQQVVITNVHAGFAGFGDQLQQTAELPVEDGIACRGPPPRSTDASISAAERRHDTMKTTLDGVVFCCRTCQVMQKTEFHRRRIFPGPSGGRGNDMRRSGESAGQRVAGGKAAGRQGGKAAGGRLQGSGRQDGGRQDGGRQGGKVAGRQSGRAAKWQGGKVAGRQGVKVAGRQSGRTAKWQGGKVAGRRSAGRQKKRGLRFFLKKIKNHFVRKSYVPASRRQGRVIAADKSGAPPAQPPKKTGETIMSRPF